MDSFDWCLFVIPGIIFDKLFYFKEAKSNKKAKEKDAADTLEDKSEL
jgi:hypothetical protein